MLSKVPSAVMTANTLLAEANYKPMLFSTPMVQAILDGRKTMTRRLCKYGKAYDIFPDGKCEVESLKTKENILPCSFKIGDIIWVRETFSQSLNPNEFCYKADTDNPIYLDKNWKWKPSLFMPKNACRLFLEITDIKLENLQSISNADAEKEGIEVVETIDTLKFFKRYSGENITFNTANAYYSFKTLWHKINGVPNWDENPFVWVYTFKQVECPQGFC